MTTSKALSSRSADAREISDLSRAPGCEGRHEAQAGAPSEEEIMAALEWRGFKFMFPD